MTKITDDIFNRLLDLRARPDFSWHRAVQVLGLDMSPEALRSRYRRRLKRAYRTSPAPQGHLPPLQHNVPPSQGHLPPSQGHLPPPLTHHHHQPLHITARTILVLADLHIPYTNTTLLEQACRRVRPDAIILAGDVFDFASVSRWPAVDPRATLEQEFSSATPIISYLTSIAPTYAVMGNHDERLAAKLGQPISPLAVWYPQVKSSSFSFCTAGNFYTVGHFSSRRFKELGYRFKTHIIGGHFHTIFATATGVFPYWAISIGHMSTNAAFFYREKALTGGILQAGYAVIENDRCTVFNEQHEAKIILDNRGIFRSFDEHEWHQMTL